MKSKKVFCALLFTVLLAACGTGNGGTTTSSITPTTSGLTPTIPNVTPTTSVLSNSFQGDGYSIRYANNWTKDSDPAGDNVYFKDSHDTYRWLAVHVEGVGSVPGDTDELSTANNEVLYELGHGSQCQRDTAVANKISINGITWTQLQEVCAVIGTSNTPPKLTIKVLVTTKSQKYYIIDEVTAPDVFDQVNRSIFQPMVQSFTFR
jgi:hypothetical protein